MKLIVVFAVLAVAVARPYEDDINFFVPSPTVYRTPITHVPIPLYETSFDNGFVSVDDDFIVNRFVPVERKPVFEGRTNTPDQTSRRKFTTRGPVTETLRAPEIPVAGFRSAVPVYKHERPIVYRQNFYYDD